MSESALLDPSNEPSFFVTRPRHQALFLVILTLALNLVGNGKVGLWDRDEPRYAGATREMKASGDWVVPRFNDAPRYHKPVLIYWLMGLGTAIGGDNPFGARLVSSLAGAATSLVVLILGRRMIGPTWGFLGALMFATAPIVVAEAKLATTDATLALFLVTAQACLWELGKRESKRLAVLFWVSMGLATLTKGPVGPALIASAGVASWWFRGPTACWKRLHWRWGLPGFLLLTLPWYVAVGIKTDWAFYRFAVNDQVIKRVGSAMEDHGGFPGYYLIFSLVLFHPWSALVPASMASAWSKRKTSPEFGFLLGWAIGPLIVLELVQTKLIHYYLPAFPALAFLSASFLESVSGSELLTIRRFRLGGLAISLLGGVGFCMAIGLFGLVVVLPSPLLAPSIVLGLVILVGTLLASLRLHQGATADAARGLVVTWSLAMVLLGGWFLPSAEPYRLSRLVGERLAELSARDGSKPVMVTYQEPGIVYALGRPAPVMKNWNLVWELLQTQPSLVAPVFPNQYKSLCADPRFQVEMVDELDGFNLNKGQQYWLKFAKITLNPSTIARTGGAEQPLVK